MYAEMLQTGRRPGSTGKIPQRCGKDGNQIIQDGHAHYYQAVYDGNVYIGSNPLGTPVTTQAGLSATTPALTLYNPVASGVNLVLWKFSAVANAAPAAATSVALAFNLATAAAPTSTTNANITNALVGNANTGKGQCYRIATLAAAPVAIDYFAFVSAASLVAYGSGQFFLDGSIVLIPGVAVSIQTTTALSVLASFSWEEVEV